MHEGGEGRCTRHAERQGVGCILASGAVDAAQGYDPAEINPCLRQIPAGSGLADADTAFNDIEAAAL